MIKTVKMSEETHQRIRDLGKLGDTMEDAIIKALNCYEKYCKR
jgi:hypothetical protein